MCVCMCVCVCVCVCGPRAITKDHDVCRVLTYIDRHLVRLCPSVQEGDHPKWEHSEAGVVVEEPVLVSICVRRTDDSGLWKCFTYHFLSKCLGRKSEEEGERGRKREEERGGGRRREEEEGDKGVQVHAIRRLTNSLLCKVTFDPCNG